jgi:UDPglucose 6-dehydrogenase
MDIDASKINQLSQGKIPIYEPGLEPLVIANLQEGRLSFTTDIKKAVRESEILFIAVGTPPKTDGSCDLSNVVQVAEEIATHIDRYKIVVTKSTVPVGTTERVKNIILENSAVHFGIASNPEFLKEGDAVHDFQKPDRIVIGTEDEATAAMLRELYAPFVRTQNPIIVMGIRSAEMTKYAANAMLATKISFINEIANICERVNADVSEVRLGIGSDTRIGPRFIFPGLGYGGSCFPKDVKALIHSAREHNYDPQLLCAVETVNAAQKINLIPKITEYFDGQVRGLTFALWGLSFKPETDDIRESPAISMIHELLTLGAHIKVYDPKAMTRVEKIYGNKISYAAKNYDALENADALIIATEWKQFRNPDYARMRQLLKHAVVFDGRNILNQDELKKHQIDYVSVGKSRIKKKWA